MHRVRRQPSRVVAVRVPAGNPVHPLPDKIQDLVNHSLGHTIVPKALRQSFTEPKPTISRPQQHRATVGAAPLLVKPNDYRTLRQIVE